MPPNVLISTTESSPPSPHSSTTAFNNHTKHKQYTRLSKNATATTQPLQQQQQQPQPQQPQQKIISTNSKRRARVIKSKEKSNFARKKLEQNENNNENVTNANTQTQVDTEQEYNNNSIVAANNNVSNATHLNDNTMPMYGSSYYGASPMMGMGYGGGMGMGMGMGMSPYSSYGMGMAGMGLGMGMGMGGTGPLNGLNQLLFSFQTIVFSLGQAMQVLGMNTQALHQLYNQAMSMLDQVLATIHELKTLENSQNDRLSEEDQKRRRRLKALRWSIMLGFSYAGYSFFYKWLKRRREYKLRRSMAIAGSGTGTITGLYSNSQPGTVGAATGAYGTNNVIGSYQGMNNINTPYNQGNYGHNSYSRHQGYTPNYSSYEPYNSYGGSGTYY